MSSERFKVELDCVHAEKPITLGRGASASFKTWGKDTGLERRVSAPQGTVICHCNGTIAAVNQCVVNASALMSETKSPSTQDIESVCALVARTCGEQGLKAIFQSGKLGTLSARAGLKS